MVERSFEMIIGIMGILKAGGAYLPIDPEYPNSRIEFMLKDSNAKLLLTQSHLNKNVEHVDYDGEKIYLDTTNAYRDNPHNPTRVNTSKDLSYVIYTSGSTGNPKGVLVEHQSLVNLLYYHNSHYSTMEQDAHLLVTSISFDASVDELFIWMLNGGRLCLPKNGAEKDVFKIVEYIEKYKISHVGMVPSLLRIILESLNNEEDKAIFNRLKYAFIGGEELKSDLVKLFYQSVEIIGATTRARNGVCLVNCYGPTEATVDSTTCLISPDDINLESIPIGKPVDNVSVYIVDRNNQLQPIGIPGELCIAGDGLAQGYLNQPDLTREKFVDNPFEPEAKMYRTGDLSRWLPDGNIEFLGRIDHQVKIRGFRIELEEIEHHLLSCDQVKDCVVIDREDENEERYLCAYIVVNSKVEMSALREVLRGKLPDYMIPSIFLPIDKLPLTPNGKVDRKALPAPDGSLFLRNEYVAPTTATELRLVQIWQAVLGIEKIGVTDYFQVLARMLGGTVLGNWLYRAIGVKVGKRTLVAQLIVHHDADLISIGNGVWIGSNLQLFPTVLILEGRQSEQSNSCCYAAPIIIEDQAIIAETCLMQAGSYMEPWSSLGSLVGSFYGTTHTRELYLVGFSCCNDPSFNSRRA